MKQVLTILSFLIVFQFSVKGQGLQPGECGVMFTYDASGGLIERRILCNNSGSIILRSGTVSDSRNRIDSSGSVIEKAEVKEEIVKVNAIMPNPTTGKFSVTLSSPLKHVNVVLIDENGKAIENKRVSGSVVEFDISTHPAGIYFVRIAAEGKVYTFKVIKL